MFFFERFGTYLFSIVTAVVLSLLGWLTLGYSFENIFMMSGIVITVIGVSMNSKNSYRNFGGKTGVSKFEYDTFVEMRSEKERQGDYDYTDRSHGFEVGTKLVLSGLFTLIIGILLSYLIPYLQ